MRPRPFPKDHPGHDVWEPVQSKSAKPHLRVMPRNCGNPYCGCQQVTNPEAAR